MTATSENISHDMKTETNAAQYLTFIMNDEEYGIDILRVQGIQGWDTVTEIPNTPDYVLGVINLRGAVVPIIDLRRRLGIPSIDFGPTTVVIIVRVGEDNEGRTVGLVVDAVSEVYSIEDDDLAPAPDFGRSANTEYVRALATVDNKMVILMDIAELMDEEDFGGSTGSAAFD